MARYELKMPKMGESIIEATILNWTKEVGDEIEAEETVLEIATDKVDSEVPSPVEGKLLERRFQANDVVPVGEVIAIIETEVADTGNGAAEPTPEAETEPVTVEAAEAVPYVPQREAVGQAAAVNHSDGDRFYSPLVLNIARQEQIAMSELEQLEGSGRDGRVTKKDILAYVQQRATNPAAKPSPAPEVRSSPAVSSQPQPASPPATKQPPASNYQGQADIVEMDRMRKLIAHNMVASKQTSAHVTSFVEADVTNIVHWRNRVKKAFEQQYGDKLTFTPIFLWAVARALREMPLVNSSVEGDKILVKKEINLGVAVALPTDNLIVPVIRNADRLNLSGLSAAINDLASRARANKLKPDELQGGTYTVSNVGTFGNVMGTPIIMQPQVAILATGAIRKVAAVIETPTGDMIGVRQRMFLSHSYDHRIIDGALGGRFVKRVGDLLEGWDLDAEI
jgi:2-oxoglutarate dehydrogenase E2 component (dihydrolipoamide succinyltransferase)